MLKLKSPLSAIRLFSRIDFHRK